MRKKLPITVLLMVLTQVFLIFSAYASEGNNAKVNQEAQLQWVKGQEWEQNQYSLIDLGVEMTDPTIKVTEYVWKIDGKPIKTEGTSIIKWNPEGAVFNHEVSVYAKLDDGTQTAELTETLYIQEVLLGLVEEPSFWTVGKIVTLISVAAVVILLAGLYLYKRR